MAEIKEIQLASVIELLVDFPPTTTVALEDVEPNASENCKVTFPDIQLYCTSNLCRRAMIHSCRDKIHYPPYSKVYECFVRYVCNHCRSRYHQFALSIRYIKDQDVVAATKLGQNPSYGPPLSDKLLALAGPDREVFLQGRRSENQGLGIGAYAYYRRVVENQRTRILDLVMSTAEKLGLGEDVLKTFEQAKRETQFSKSVQMVKDVFPESLRLKGGHNPLTLLHDALSDGIHAQSDEDCLKYASAIRVVLTALAERVDRVLSDEREVEEALKTLLHRPVE